LRQVFSAEAGVVHLYIHVPFCARRCSYCDFAIAVRRDIPETAFVNAVLHEWSGWQAHPWWEASPPIASIYFGGGTPSRLSPSGLGAILSRIRADRQVATEPEVTLEANPDDVSEPAADAWLALGINRVSLGAQSFSAAALSWMHRTHDTDQIEKAASALRRAGFQNWSLDLIYALPDSIRRDWPADLSRALALEPNHLSLYALTVEQGTPLGRWTARGEALPAPEERAAHEFLFAHQTLGAAGFEHYEVSNWALPGFRSRHNSAYWLRRPFIGLGPSAHSGNGPVRCWNVREWEEYRRRAEVAQGVRAELETLNPDQIALEELYLGLRTAEGIPGALIAGSESRRWLESGWAEEHSGRIALTPEGWLRLDALVASLTRC
jgi:oxygen-independent coproporphyrinogen III oxidase